MPALKTIAVTRPGEDGQALCAKLAQQGHTAFHVPMLTINSVPDSLPKLKELLTLPLQAFCVTSKHAVRILAQQPEARDIPVFAVGHATANAARQAGFSTVITADDTATSLIARILDHCKRDKGILLYLRGRDVTRDIVAELAAHSFNAMQLIVYEALAITSLPLDYMQALKAGKVDEVVFYSRASAANYAQLILREKLSACHASVTAVCVSETVAEALSSILWRERRVLSVSQLQDYPA